MIRRAAITLTLIGILVGALASEAMSLRGRHATQITIQEMSQSSGEMVVAGDLSSNYRNCIKYRRVGLFLGDNMIDSRLTDAYGHFTLTGVGAPGTYTVFAYKEYAVGRCGHLCKLAKIDVTF